MNVFSVTWIVMNTSKRFCRVFPSLSAAEAHCDKVREAGQIYHNSSIKNPFSQSPRIDEILVDDAGVAGEQVSDPKIGLK